MMKARDIDTLMSIIAVVFTVVCFLFLKERPVDDIIKVGVFIACPTKFIAVARCLEIVKKDLGNLEEKDGKTD